MSAPSIWTAPSGDTIRTVEVDGAVWFVAADVCRELDLGNTTMALGRIDYDDISSTEVTDSMGRAVHVRSVNESGLYELVLGSRKPEARAFRRWVTAEVIPEIRRTGTYGVVVAPQFEIPTTLAGALRLAADESERADRAEVLVAEMAPKAEIHDALMSADGDMSVREAAQALVRAGVDTGQGRLFASLVAINWLDKSRQPLQRHVDRAVLVRKVTTYVDSLGDMHASTQVRVTPKGLAELVRRLGPASMGLVTG